MSCTALFRKSMIPQGAKGCVSEFLPDTDSHLNQWIKGKVCAKEFAVVKHLEKHQRVIIYLMEAKLSVTCTQVKCFDFAEWLWWMSVPSCLWSWRPLNHARCYHMEQSWSIIHAAPYKICIRSIRAALISLSPWGSCHDTLVGLSWSWFTTTESFLQEALVKQNTDGLSFAVLCSVSGVQHHLLFCSEDFTMFNCCLI